jgi:exopolysaccharide production protein ExoZ
LLVILGRQRLRKLSSLQALRALAAIAVVGHHSLRAVTLNAPSVYHLPVELFPFSATLVELGVFGVDVFFILSGFLMVTISQPYIDGSKPVGHFLLYRLIRVWPMYCLATLIYISMKVASHLLKGEGLPFDMSITRLMSLFFIPSFNEDGVLQPILWVGWTLNYEIIFYVSFTAAVLCGSRRLLPALAAILIVLFGIGSLLPASTALGTFLSNPILFEFLFGAFVAYCYPPSLRSETKGLWVLLLGIGMLLAFSFVSNESEARFLARGLPSLLIFYGFLMLERRTAWPNWAIFLGNASYSIYLFHIILIYPVANKILSVLSSRGMVTSAQILAATAAIAASIVAGVIVHLLLEKPITRGLQSVFKPKSNVIPAI